MLTTGIQCTFGKILSDEKQIIDPALADEKMLREVYDLYLKEFYGDDVLEMMISNSGRLHEVHLRPDVFSDYSDSM